MRQPPTVEGWAIEQVLSLAFHYRSKWLDKDNNYWFQRLSQEIGELASVLADDHDDTMEHELEQIASISINWLRKLAKEREGLNK